MRIGIGHPGDKALVHPYVLSDFAKAEEPWVEDLAAPSPTTPPLLAKGDDAEFPEQGPPRHGKGRAE